MKQFIKKHYSNILFFLFIVLLFTPYGMPVRTFLIKQIAFVTTRVLPIENNENEKIELESYEWSLKSINGNDVNFSDLKNKVIIVNFWATWCPPCIAEMPSFQNLFDQFKEDEEVAFLFVTTDDRSKVDRFLQKKEYNIPVYFPVNQIPKELSSNSIPATFIIDKQGKIIVDKVGAVDWNSSRIIDLINSLKSK
ncbi:TlpA family protein disulfide reductase [Namhaeicola litoreus]|uniref:TlpA family protein disulfide reductase n=1 Tax=Namhaeicola litoreus TaxID=1052145 RepID=A0ABW3Y6E6_9FLAO